MRNSLAASWGLLTNLVLVLLATQASAGTPATGHPTFASPMASPMALSPVLDELYVANTAADTLDVIRRTHQWSDLCKLPTVLTILRD